ncbi:MobH family relaxase [Methylomicrobium album]|uniref:Putative helicase n=1 Tax=Methylomicrobium album BG8 TaxID=686340 RepID=H8GP24_METAL|nr:MobH family relaxase [Methylomicrobium album]EIC28446.1 Putative helicase [Methylomicrobium album BG8]
MRIINSDFINRLGNLLFGQRPALSTVQSPPPEEEIPRYPPFMKGLPAAPVERILSSQVELIKAIEHALSLPDDLYRTIAEPVIARYAAFSHLLPASESHHHRGAGGLFRHGLEVAHWATQSAQGCLFATHATPRERKEQELRWRLAVCFAGLLHDIGKPVSDIAVVDREGEHLWNPCEENLTDWASQHGIDRYFLRWRENRHKRHEQFSALVIERVLTRASRSYLLAPGPDIMQAMLEAIHGLDRGAKLYELVMAADRKSVERDLKAHYHTVDSAMGMPVEKYLFDAMRRLIKSGHWLANEKGARLWRFKEGIHIVWRTGAQDIVDLLAKDKVPGIPRDEDTLADILIERGLAIPKTLPDGRHYRYWRMQPQGLDVVLYMLRLASTELIYSNEPPVAIEAIEVEEDLQATVKAESGQDKAGGPEVQPNAQMTTSLVTDGMMATSAMGINQEQNDTLASNQETATAPDQSFLQECQDLSNKDEMSDTPLNPTARVESINTNTAISQPAVQPIEKAGTSKKDKRPNTPLNPDANNEQPVIPSSEIDSVDAARNWLYAHGLAGEWLIQLANKINLGNLQWGTALLEAQGKWLLPFPDTAQKLHVEQNLFIKTLEEKGWLVTDILSPMRKVQVINQVRGVLLAQEPSGFLKQLIQVPGSLTVAMEQAPKIAERTHGEDKKVKPLPIKPEKSGKRLDPNKASIADNPVPVETGASKVHPVKPAQAKPEAFYQPKRQSDSEPSITQKPSKPKSAVDTVSTKFSMTKVAHSTPFGTQAVMALIDQLRKTRPVSNAGPPGKDWCIVEESDIVQCLQQHPGLKRSTLLREMASHPDCRIEDGGFKVRVGP